MLLNSSCIFLLLQYCLFYHTVLFIDFHNVYRNTILTSYCIYIFYCYNSAMLYIKFHKNATLYSHNFLDAVRFFNLKLQPIVILDDKKITTTTTTTTIIIIIFIITITKYLHDIRIRQMTIIKSYKCKNQEMSFTV